MIIICRLALFNQAGLQLIEKVYGLEKFLVFLEKNCGGHGNGYIIMNEGRITSTGKGLKFSCKDIAAEFSGTVNEYALFHTRIASAGSVKDANCHPYVDETTEFALMMNGTEKNFSNMARSIDITDTELVFRTMVNCNMPLKALSGLTANYLGVKDGKVFAVSNSSYQPLEFIEHEGAIIIASTFPRVKEIMELGVHEMCQDALWEEGDELIARPSFRLYSHLHEATTGKEVQTKTPPPSARVVEKNGQTVVYQPWQHGWANVEGVNTKEQLKKDLEMCRNANISLIDETDVVIREISLFDEIDKQILLAQKEKERDNIDKSSK